MNVTHRYFVLILSLFVSNNAFGWGADGHSLVALIAERHLTDEAAMQVERIADGKSLSYLANWPDRSARSMPEFRNASPWHYINLKEGELFSESNPPIGKNVVWGIEHFAEALGDDSVSKKRRWQALAWVAHFVGDIHQPLHCGYKEDRGGNSINVNYEGNRVSLHKVWDTVLLVENGLRASDSMASELDQANVGDISVLQAASPLEIANESRGYLGKLYQGLGASVGGRSRIGEEYEAWAVGVVRERLVQGGVRLAGILNEIFSSEVPMEAAGFAGYYSSLPSAGSSEFRNSLNDLLVSTHETKLTYDQVWTALKSLDEDPNDDGSVLLFYTDRSESKNNRDRGQNDGDSWNREHIWAKSHGFPAKSKWAYTDIHHLVAADRSTNSNRSNDDFSEISENEGGEHGECDCQEVKRDGVWYWEPPAERKGDVARMLFYMAVRYDGDAKSKTPDLVLKNGGTKSGDPEFGVLADLLEWHEEDPVSDRERGRNRKVQTIQGNRNPFVDHPKWVEIIWDSN